VPTDGRAIPTGSLEAMPSGGRRSPRAAFVGVFDWLGFSVGQVASGRRFGDFAKGVPDTLNVRDGTGGMVRE
jgi:hypothetical protein